MHDQIYHTKINIKNKKLPAAKMTTKYVNKADKQAKS